MTIIQSDELAKPPGFFHLVSSLPGSFQMMHLLLHLVMAPGMSTDWKDSSAQEATAADEAPGL